MSHPEVDAFLISEILWATLFAYWLYSGRNAKKTETRESGATRAAHLAVILTGFFLLLSRRDFPPPLSAPLFPGGAAREAAGLLINAAGVAFAIWARATLGRNWSGAVTLKADHQLIRSGPYRFVRHPIYTGIFFGAVGTALVVDEFRGALGSALILSAYLVKIQKEEKLLKAHFPSDYPKYRVETKKIIPFVY